MSVGLDDLRKIDGFGAIAAALLTLEAIKKQANIMAAQTEIMAKQVALGTQKERPRISIKPGQCFFNPKEATRISYAIECYCPSPAFIVDTSIEIFTRAAMVIVPVPFEIDIPKQVLQSGELPRYAIVCVGAHSEIVDSEEVRKKHVVIHMCGFIKYTGIHLAEKDAPYITAFAYDWIPIEYADNPHMGYWQENGENYQT